MNKLDLLICIDDTDNLESRGTGAIASEMASLIEEKGWGRCDFITRHQLYIHEDVPYTSHNSAMCFTARVEADYLSELKETLVCYLREEMAEGSDPGICIADIRVLSEGDIGKRLGCFGSAAKREVLNKRMAYDLAGETGVFLTETGGTGDGVIGALAGVGLRFEGNDGEVKGGIDHLEPGMSFSVETLLKEKLITSVCTADLKPLPPEARVSIIWKAKPVLCEGEPVLLALPGTEKGSWVTMEKHEMRKFGDDRAGVSGTSREDISIGTGKMHGRGRGGRDDRACSHFKPDVPEEMISDDLRSCRNCAYRRWTEDSFICIRKKRVKTADIPV